MKKAFVVVLILILPMIVAGEQVVPPPEPLPEELEEYYWDLRVQNLFWLDSIGCGCPPLDNCGYVLRSRSIISPYKEY